MKNNVHYWFLEAPIKCAEQGQNCLIYVFFKNPNFASTTLHIGDWVSPKKKKETKKIYLVNQDKVGEIFKTCKYRVDYPKDINFQLFGFRFIEELPWDLDEWTWKNLPFLGAAFFFGYSSKRGYKTLLPHQQIVSQTSKFIAELEDSLTSKQQIFARLWHFLKFCRMSILICLMLNKNLHVGTWLQKL